MFKKKTITVVAFLLALLIPILGLAHSGKTDENGGHYDSSTGEYHYHHGYPAHHHPGGVCPYDFDDQTGSSSGSSSGSAGSATLITNKYYDGYDKGYDAGYDEGYFQGRRAGYDEGFKDGKPLVPNWCFVVFGVLILLILVLCIVIKHKNKIIIQDKAKYEHNLEKQQKEFSDGLTTFANDIFDRYGCFYLHEISQVPNHVLINDDLIPQQRHSFDLPDEYEFYCTSPIGYQDKQITYHRRTCHHVKTFAFPVSVVTIDSKRWAFKKCSKCNPEIPRLFWFYKYKKHYSFLEENAPNRKKVDLSRRIRPSSPTKEDNDARKINYRD